MWFDLLVNHVLDVVTPTLYSLEQFGCGSTVTKMAEEAIKKLEHELNCSICLDTYTDPKLLQCFHVYCRKCLVPLVDRDQRGQLGITCPTCRQVTPIPDKGVAGLQSAFHINRLLEIQESFQKVENPMANAEEGAAPIDTNAGKKIGHCFVHEGKELELYCETCGELICNECALKSGTHHSHDYEELDQAFEKYKVEIISSLKPMEMQVTTIKKALMHLDTSSGQISYQLSATEDDIHSTFKELQEVLNVREAELVSQLDLLTRNKLKDLAAQRDQIETTLAQLCSCLQFVKESLRTGNEEDVLMMKANTVNQIRELTVPLQPDILKLSAEADISFLDSVDTTVLSSASADMTLLCQNYGEPSLPKCCITGLG